jgi:hypothetical protein
MSSTDLDINEFSLNKYLEIIETKIISILERPSNYSYIPDILDDENDVRDKLISL